MAMVRNIEKDLWAVVLANITLQHAGQPVAVQEYGRETGELVVVRALPLRSISFDGKGGDAGAVEVLLGTEADDHISHRVAEPTGLQITYDSTGSAVAIEVQSAADPSIMVTFHPVHGPVASR